MTADASILEACGVVGGLLGPAVKDLAKGVRRFRRAQEEGGGEETLAEPLHKVRVESRRLGVALAAVKGLAEPRAWKQLRRAVRRIRRAAGVIRDGDVHLRILRELAQRQDVPLAGLDALISAVESDRARGFARLSKVLAKAGPRRLRAMCDELVDGAEGGPITADALATQELSRFSRDLLAVASQDVSRPECLHEVRLSIKRLRYALEIFEGCIDDSVRAAALGVMEESQKVAGEANDLMTLVDRLDLLIADLESAGAPDGELIAAWSGLRARFAGVAELRRRKFAEYWSSVNVPELLRPLAGQEPAEAVALTPTKPEPREATPSRLTERAVAPGSDPANDGRARAESARQANLWLAGKRLGVIDIGSNSIRLLAVELIDERSWKTLAEERAMTRLAHGLGDTGQLCAEAMARSVEAIGRFKSIAEKLGVTSVKAFATAAVREARNRADFMSLVQDRTGLKLELVSALEEGKLTHRSVSRVYDLSHGTCAVVDIGGGSMEVVFSQDGVITENSSMPLGAVRVTEAFGGADACSGPRFKKMRRWVAEQIEDHVRDHEPPPTMVVGCGGAFTTLLTLAAAARGVMIDRSSPALTTLGPVSVESLRAILDTLRSMKLEQRLRVPGLPSDRADIVVAGFTAIERLLKHLGVSQVHVHPGGFREGLLLRMIDQEVAERNRTVADAGDAELVASARDFAVRCRYERAHSEQVARLAVSLYDQFLAESNLLHRLGSFPHERALLEAAAVLHDIGILVEYRRHHRHSQAMILHADLPHWDPHQLELVALIARYHRRAVPSLDHDDFASLSEPEQALVRRMSAILRTADGLDRSHTQGVRAARVRFGKRQVDIEVNATEEVGIDLRAADKKSDLLRDVTGTRVEIAYAPAAATAPEQA